MARLETVFADTAKTLDRVSKSRRTAAGAVHDAGEQTNTFALAEPYAPLANGFKRLAHTLKADADLLASQVRSVCSPSDGCYGSRMLIRLVPPGCRA